MADRTRDDLVVLAKSNVCSGVIEEPRVFTPTDGVFRNNEKFPVRITHLVMNPQPSEGIHFAGTDINIRMFDHTYLVRGLTLPAFLFANTVLGASDVITRNSAAWKFERPFILSSRDSMEVRIQVTSGIGEGRQVQVTFTGIGAQSKRPYFLCGEATLTDTDAITMDVEQFRTDGTEPIVITDVVVTCGAYLDGEGLVGGDQGDISLVNINIRQLGNGTGQWWASTTGAVPMVPALLWGISSGTAIVHRFAGDGLIWEPGEGLEAGYYAGQTETSFDINTGALFGYISVT